MENKGLFTRAVKYSAGYLGFVEFWNNGEKLWSKSCSILRVYKSDALQDAKIEKQYIENTNVV